MSPGAPVDPRSAADGREPPELEIQHFVPGRVRLRSASLRGHPERTAELELRLRESPAVRDVCASPLTGSVRVHYEPRPGEPLGEALRRAVPGLQPAAIERFAAQASPGLGRAARAPQTPPAGHGELRERIAEAAHRLSDAVGERAGGADLSVLAPALLVAFGTYRLYTSRRELPHWYEYFWYALNLFSTLHRETGR